MYSTYFTCIFPLARFFWFMLKEKINSCNSCYFGKNNRFFNYLSIFSNLYRFFIVPYYPQLSWWTYTITGIVIIIITIIIIKILIGNLLLTILLQTFHLVINDFHQFLQVYDPCLQLRYCSIQLLHRFSSLSDVMGTPPCHIVFWLCLREKNHLVR